LNDNNNVKEVALDSENDDGREIGNWESRWPPKAKKIIYYEAFYVGIIFVITLFLIVLTWRGVVFDILSNGDRGSSHVKFNQFVYFFLGGTLGGILFGMKYLYKVVASGLWNEDRKLWRIFSPFISGALALIIGALLDSGIMGISIKASSSTAYFSIGFITGYFADSALAKMQEISEIIFSTKHKNSN